ncbi:MAG: DUF1330 domain-containing protein, partial [Xanthobacteraceae bacterium]
AAVQVLHAQAISKAYIVTETEVLDAAALAAYTPQVRAAIAAAGGRPVARAGGKTVAFVGQPQRVSITEWDSMEKAQAYRNSAAYKDLAPQRDKAVKSIRAFAIDASTN